MLSEEELYRIKKWIKALENDDSSYKPPSFSYLKLGSGRNRRVYDLENGTVLKVAKTLKGIRDISREKEIYRKAPPEVQKYLAEILAGGHGWLIMRKYPSTVPESCRNPKDVEKLIERFERYGINARDLISRRSGFILWFNMSINSDGDLIAIDYGNFGLID